MAPAPDEDSVALLPSRAAKESGVSRRLGPAVLVPAAGCAIAGATIVTCYILTQLLHHTSFITPPISLTGNHAPESYVYSLGFTLAGALFALAAVLQLLALQEKALDVLGAYEGAVRLANLTATVTGILSGLFLALHAVVPMQPDADAILLGEDIPITIASQVHQSMAGLFFSTGILHCSATLYVWRALRASAPCAAAYRVKLFILCVLLFLFFVGPALFPALIGKVESGASRKRNAWGALLQYALVASLLAFTASSTADLRGASLQLALAPEPRRPAPARPR
eukprot:tig00001065_g6703.t1